MPISREVRLLEAKWKSGQGWPKRLDWVSIRGIRGWAGQRINLTFPLMAIVGENGAGKSTILQAIASSYDSEAMGRRNFASYFFPDTPWEEIKSAEIQYMGRQGTDVFGGTVRKPGERWRGNPERKERDVVWIDLGRIQPIPARTGYLKIAKPQVRETLSQAFDEDTTTRLSQIMGRKYDTARMAITEMGDDRPVPVISHRGKIYSGFHSGSGELVSAELISASMPKGAIVLIDEIESSLHPRAQRRVIRDLAQLARQKDLQIVFTTHSPYVLDELPPEGRLFVTDTIDGKALIYGISPFFALTSMDDEHYPECDIYVEDGIAEDLLREIIVAAAPEILSRLRFIPYGPANVGRALGQMDSERRFPNKSCVFLDGDQEPSTGCHILPGGDAPERVLFDALAGHWPEVGTRVGRGASQVADACEKAMTRATSREWIDAAADSLLLKGGILWQAMCATWATKQLPRSKALEIVDAIRIKLGAA
ncbi:MAG TPA: AAA family ATPase [Lysobacter sp.]|jgi:predicted ATPase|nr:AAA family ATPase [Lysobacter sp.]